MFNFELAISVFESAKIDYLINVPATSMNPIYNYYESKTRCIYASREEEGLAIASGIAVAGYLPLLMIQQSGVGNMLNCLFGLAECYEIYFPILVLDRGISDENPVQAYSSLQTNKIIRALEEPVVLDFSDLMAESIFRSGIECKRRWYITNY
ncbi:thiamine pyrophosphate-binding protein [Pedobacter gandavensis]|uniref:thiamine pyrophosphate-binding protein n=1 Tax=Pedobacter gandavensis TaxID=2679963 RepID=UPI00247A6CB3|nr:thiamine pyrophosphate-binding protein [Pedobacter gandavensis]WGQ10942.1 thiamine pyrophosphate-binding protein [Pedobacter gandavensis]